MRTRAIVAAICLLVASLSSDGFAASQFIPLSSLRLQGQVVEAAALSADGSTVVGWKVGYLSDAPQSAVTEAFRWTATGGFQRFGLPASDEFLGSIPTGVSADGNAVVGTLFGENTSQAFLWNATEGLTGLGFLSPGPISERDHTQADAVSPDGNTVYGISTLNNGVRRPFRWSRDVGLKPYSHQVTAITANGAALVGNRGTEFGEEAVRASIQGVVGLGFLPDGPDFSNATGISADGKTVVGFGYSSQRYAAFQWTEESGIQLLETLPRTRGYTHASAVTADGRIVLGKQGNGREGADAFVWDRRNGIRDLRDVLSQDYDLGPALGRWRLNDVVGVSSDGRTLAGNGIHPNGHAEAWVIRLDRRIGVPEPTTLALALAWCLMTLRKAATGLASAVSANREGNGVRIEWH